ncbi:MAG: ABC transporter permease [Cyclobacteriaceae bacterium]
MQLNNSHISFIREDLERRGLVADDLLDELVDHFCEKVGERMDGGIRFFEAYQWALDDFGAERTVRMVQEENIRITQQPKNMLRNYFLIAWRNIKKQKFYSFINIFGLAVGIAASMLISLYVINELQYDNFHVKGDRIYRITSDIHFGENDFNFAVAPAPMAAALIQDFPEIENVVRFRSYGSNLIRPIDENSNIKVDRLVYSDSTFFDIFSFSLLQGNPETALSGTNKAIISRSTAERLYGTIDVLGKQVFINGSFQAEISGVYENMPANSHLQFDTMVSMETLQESFNTIWLSNNFYTYLLLQEGADPEALEAKFPDMVERYIGPQVKQFTGQDFEEAKQSGAKIEFILQPLTEIYLKSNFTFDIGQTGDIQVVYIFSAIALLIIVLACINFMNLSTARSATRAKEVGIRKVLGSVRPHLIRQFLTESILLTAISFLIALGLASLFLPWFNRIAQKSLTLPFDDPAFYIISIGGILLLGSGAGLYPSLFLSAFRPVQVLKGKILNSRSGTPVRSTLVVFQFVITIVLLLGTAAVYKQLDYIQSKKLGFDKEQVLIVRDAYMLGNDTDVYKNRMLASANVRDATLSGYLPIEKSNRSDMSFWEEGKSADEENMVNSQVWQVDHSYIPTLGMNIVEGRNFSVDFPSDSSAVILNERAVQAFNLNDPVGSRIVTLGMNPENNEIIPDETITFTVIGVVEDFHFNNMHQAISPLMFQLGRNEGYLSFRFNSENAGDVITLAEKEWNTLNPGTPFSYTFLSDEFATMYTNEKRLGQVFSIFAGLAILIGCLGLFGLATYLAEQRTKEIGIRKVLGASNEKIIVLLSRDFGRLIIVAILISIPLAWYMIREWLVSFEYKTKVGWEIYAAVALVAMLIAGISILYQSIKAALSNPAEIIRNE